MLGKIPAARLALIEKIVAQRPEESCRARGSAARREFLRRVLPRCRRRRSARASSRGTWPPPRSRTWNSAVGARGQSRAAWTSRRRSNADAPTAAHRSLLRVVSPDMPFLVDSIGIVFSQMNIAVHLIVHPVLGVRRDARGNLKAVGSGQRARACSNPGR